MSQFPNILTLENSFNQITVSLFGGQVLTWKTLNSNNQWVNMLYTGTTPKRSGIPILFPFANPLKDDIFVPTGAKMGQHGFARNYNWNIVSQTPETLKLSLKYTDLDEQLQKDYPYTFELFLNLDISEKNNLIYELELVNLSDKSIPIAPGIHPYFPIKHEMKPTLQIAEIPKFNAQTFPWDGALDGDFFDYHRHATVKFPEFNLEIEETSNFKQFENLVIWSQNLSNPDHNFVCLEPFSRKTNAINDKPILVNSSEPWKGSFRFKCLEVNADNSFTDKVRPFADTADFLGGIVEILN